MIDRSNYMDNLDNSLNERFIISRPFKFDKEGKYLKGDLPDKYFTELPSSMGKDAHTTNYDSTDLKILYRNTMIQNRIIREMADDEEYDTDDFLRELDRENAVMVIAYQNKAGPYNNRRLMNTSITENTSKNIEALETAKQKLGGLFDRK